MPVWNSPSTVRGGDGAPRDRRIAAVPDAARRADPRRGCCAATGAARSSPSRSRAPGACGSGRWAPRRATSPARRCSSWWRSRWTRCVPPRPWSRWRTTATCGSGPRRCGTAADAAPPRRPARTPPSGRRWDAPGRTSRRSWSRCTDAAGCSGRPPVPASDCGRTAPSSSRTWRDCACPRLRGSGAGTSPGSTRCCTTATAPCAAASTPSRPRPPHGVGPRPAPGRRAGRTAGCRRGRTSDPPRPPVRPTSRTPGASTVGGNGGVASAPAPRSRRRGPSRTRRRRSSHRPRC